MTKIPTNQRDFIRFVKQSGSHFFDPDTMRYFNSRFEPGTLKPVSDTQGYFITSEQFVDSKGIPHRREWNLRRYELEDTGFVDIETVQTFYGLELAHEALHNIKE